MIIGRNSGWGLMSCCICPQGKLVLIHGRAKRLEWAWALEEVRSRFRGLTGEDEAHGGHEQWRTVIKEDTTNRIIHGRLTSQKFAYFSLFYLVSKGYALCIKTFTLAAALSLPPYLCGHSILSYISLNSLSFPNIRNSQISDLRTNNLEKQGYDVCSLMPGFEQIYLRKAHGYIKKLPSPVSWGMILSVLAEAMDSKSLRTQGAAAGTEVVGRTNILLTDERH